jgi:hypothetical protein
MKPSLDFLVQTLLDIQLRADQETMWHYGATILQAEYAAEFGTSATLMDIVTQDQCHEVHLKDALGLGG